jgi:hypothetical protein
MKIRHKTRLNISDRYKIMVNPPKMNLGITRSHARVEHKNIFIFCYKNHLDKFIIKTKQFIIKDLHSNFVQFLVQKA